MATRENQGLQIALILFVMTTLLLAVTTFIFYRSAAEKAKDALAARGEAQRAQQDFKISFFKEQALMYMLGANNVTKSDVESMRQSIAADKVQDLAAIEEAFQQDMAMFGAGLPVEELNYKNLPRHLGDSLRQANQDLATQAEEQARLIEAMQATEKREGDRANAAVAGQQQAADDLAAERKSFEEHKTLVDQSKEQLAAALTGKDDQLKAIQVRYTQEEKSLGDQISTLQGTVDTLADKIQQGEPEVFEVPDGEITWANQRERLVWINLGEKDYVRRMMTFSVYDESKAGVALGESKGSIEVTRVIGADLAEARILDDVLSNPIMKGDVIHTPAWSPGRRIQFAIAGLIDVDDDNRNDNDFIRDLVNRNGGEVLPPGNSLTAATRYLLVGEKPDENANAEMLSEYTRLVKEAQQLGIQRISVDEFLSYMGWRGSVTTTSYERSSPLGDAMTPKAGTSSSPPPSGDAFPERLPPAGFEASPF